MNNKGFSLIELITAAAIGIVLSGVAGLVFVQGTRVFHRTVEQYKTESEMLSMIYLVKSTFSQSSFINYGGVSSAATNGFSARVAATTSANPVDQNVGVLFSSSFTNNITGNAFLVAMGNREMAGGSGAAFAPNSTLRAYGAYYQTPTPTTAGTFFVDLEQNAGGGFVRLSPVNAPFAFSRIVEFGVDTVRVLAPDKSIVPGAGNVGQPVTSAEVRVMMRYYSSSLKNEWRWCPTALVAGNAACRAASSYVDVEKKIKVVFANNSYDRTNSLAPRPYGKIYFFKGIFSGGFQ